MRVHVMRTLRPSASRTLLAERRRAERYAWDSLARYKFNMFGYWAACWVHANELCGKLGLGKVANPFRDAVKVARARGFGPTRSRQRPRGFVKYSRKRRG